MKMTQEELEAKSLQLGKLMMEAQHLLDDIKAAEVEPEKRTGWAGIDKADYNIVQSNGCVGTLHYGELVWYNIANKFTDDDIGKALAERIAKQQTVFRLLKRFSDEHGGQELDWSDHAQHKYFAYYSHRNPGFCVTESEACQYTGVVYFKNRETIDQAIEQFEPLIKEAYGLE